MKSKFAIVAQVSLWLVVLSALAANAASQGAGSPPLAAGPDGVSLALAQSGDKQKPTSPKLVPSVPDLSNVTIDSGGSVGQYASMAVGTDGNPLISYYDQTNANLKVAHCENVYCTSTTITTLDSTGDMGRHSSITIGQDGFGLISYYDFDNGALKVAHCSNTACSAATITTVDNPGDVGQYSAITTGGDGLGLIAYYDQTNTALKVAHCANAACSSAGTTTITNTLTTLGSAISIARGGDGLGLILFYSGDPAASGPVKVAHCTNATCTGSTIQQIGTADGGFVSLAISASGFGILSYPAGTTLNPPPVPTHALPIGGKAEAPQATGRWIEIAFCRNAACTSYTGGRLDSSAQVQHISTISTPGGTTSLAYYDALNGDLNLVRCTSADCSSALLNSLDSAGDVGKYVSLRTGSDGLPTAAYYDATNADLKLARCCAPYQQVGTGFNYEGRLNSGGTPANGQYDMVFTLYDSATGGETVGSAITMTNQTVANGLFNVNLDFGASSFQGDARWLEVAVRTAGSGAYHTLSPRTSIAAVPYAKSLVPGAVITGTNTLATLSITNTSTISGSAGIAGAGMIGVYGSSNAPCCANSYGVYGIGRYGVYGTTNGFGFAVVGTTVGGYGVLGSTADGDGTGVSGNNSGGGFGIYGSGGTGVGGQGSSVGVNGSAFSGTGVQGNSTTGYGMYGTNNSSTNAAVYGNNTNNTGIAVQGVVSSTNAAMYGTNTGPGIGVKGTSNGNGSTGVGGYNTNSGTGVYGNSSSGGIGVWGQAPSGWGVKGESTTSYGVYGLSTSMMGVYGVSTNGYGVYGISSTSVGVLGQSGSSSGVNGMNNSSTNAAIHANNSSNAGVAMAGDVLSTNAAIDGSNLGTGPGIRGTSNGNGGNGVAGYNTNNGTGVYGNSGGGIGVWGQVTSGWGVKGESTTSYGVYGLSGSGTGVNGVSTSGYGVYGQSSSNYAGFFSGNVRITGSCCGAAAGTTQIDHPQDPANKYLNQALVESPEMKNVYDGNATTDGKGEAVVTLPGYVESLDRDFRYQLTVVGQFAQAIVASEIKGGKFTIKTDRPNVKVSWQVTGIRKDPYAEQHPLIVEQSKPDKEKGLYVHPELYGQPESKGVDYQQQQKDKPVETLNSTDSRPGK